MSSPTLRRLSVFAVAFILFLRADPVFADQPLAEKIDAILKRPEYKNARWGILVVDAAGKTVYEHNADQLFAPASVTKLYSCAAALIELGADHRFETPVFARGTITDGKLAGDLILVAQGDLTLGGRTNRSGKMAFADDDHIYASPNGTGTAVTDTDPLAGLTELARQVKAAGVREVGGDVLIDDRFFERSSGSGSGPTIVTPIMVNDNIVDVIVTPAEKAGQRRRTASGRRRRSCKSTCMSRRSARTSRWASGHSVPVRAAGPCAARFPWAPNQQYAFAPSTIRRASRGRCSSTAFAARGSR